MKIQALILLLLLPCFACAQHIYVQSWQPSEGGWIVSPEGKTSYEIPFGWRPRAHNARMANVIDWPMLFQQRRSGQASNYALLTADMEWQDITDYKAVIELGQGRFLGYRKESSEIVLLNEKLEAFPIDHLFSVGKFREKLFTVASKKNSDGERTLDILDINGRWLSTQDFSRLNDMGSGRYLAEDNFHRSCLLGLRLNENGLVEWDTLLQLSSQQYKVRPRLGYLEGQRSWLQLNSKQSLIIDLNGQVVGDTIPAINMRAFHSGRAFIFDHKNPYFVTENGEALPNVGWQKTVDYAEGLALAEETASQYFGYLDKEGSWAIAPNYCYATSFRYGHAIVAPATEENCSTLTRARGGEAHVPESITHARRIRAFQLIDQQGEVVWADSCQELYLPAPGILGINYSHNEFAQGVQVRWLAEDRSWVSPNFTVIRWQQLDSLEGHPVRRVNLGVRRFDQLTHQLFDLPDDFSERLLSPNFQQLEHLNIGSHQITPSALEAICKATELRELSFIHSDLEVLPKGIKALQKLEKLDISSTSISSLPKAIYRMTQLRELIIVDTDLPPETIPKLRAALPDTEIIFKYDY